jgi:hypothetical protein
MTMSRRHALAGLSRLIGASMSRAAEAGLGEHVLAPLEGLEEFWLATDAYIFRYPLVTMEMTRT